MRTLLASLSDHSISLLRGIAELLGIELTSNKRVDIAAQLAAILADVEITQAALTACSPAAQASWAALHAAGGHMKTALFTRLHGEIRPIGPGRLEREATWRRPQNPTEELWYRGLIYRTFADLGEGPLEYIYIPEDINTQDVSLQYTPSLRSPPALIPLNKPTNGTSMLNRMAVDACTLLAMVRLTPLTIRNADAPQSAEFDSMRGRLLLKDPVRFRLLLSLARTLGWLAHDRGHLSIDHGATGAWLRSTLWQQMTTLFVGWRDSADWNDLRQIPTLHAEGEWRNQPSLARRAVLEAMATLPAATWYLIPDLIEHIKATTPDFQRPDGNYTGWYLKDAETGRYLSGFEAWDQVEGRLISFILTGPLYWLGAVGLSPQTDGPPAFRLTAAGAAWLANTSPAELPRLARLSVGDDFVVTAPLLCPLLDRFRLLRFTEPMPGEDNEAPIATVTHHRISRRSLTQARISGLKAEAAAEFLKRATGGRVSQKITIAMTRFDRLGGKVRVSRGAVLRTTDASTLAALRADSAVAPLLGDLISAQAVLVKEDNLPRLLSIIKDSGYDVTID